MCLGAAKPMPHSDWACTLEPGNCNWLLKPTCLEPTIPSESSHHNEKPVYKIKEKPPLAATKDNPQAAVKIQHSQEYINF